MLCRNDNFVLFKSKYHNVFLKTPVVKSPYLRLQTVFFNYETDIKMIQTGNAITSVHYVTLCLTTKK